MSPRERAEGGEIGRRAGERLGRDLAPARTCTPTEACTGWWAAVTMSSGASPAQAAMPSTGSSRPRDRACGAAMVAPVDIAGRIARDRDLDQPGQLLEAQHAVAVAAMAGEHAGRADIGMAGEGHLGRAMEDAHARIVGGIVRRQDEGRLAIVHLGGKRLHLRIRQAARIGEDGERIAAELAVGEDVDGLVRKSWHGGPKVLGRMPSVLPAKPQRDQ